ncbi:MAG TPA: serine hydrolase domain-containing protein [Steroidobacteraceae bacterium]
MSARLSKEVSRTSTGRTRSVEIDERQIDAVFAELNQGQLPGVAVGIALHGKPVYRKGFGLANMELPVLLSPTIRMRIGSVTKHFTAFAYMLLCEEGRASVDDTIVKYLPELHPVTHSITLRQLMGHTSGLRDASDIRFRFGGFEGRPVSCDELLRLYRTLDDVDTPPGTAWMYNNGGYMLLSAIIERITGQDLGEVLRARIFAPIGMNDTLLRRWDTDFVPNSATSHTMSSSGTFEKRYWGLDFAGAGGMVSTVDDLLRWLAHMDAPLVGTARTWTAMKAPHTLTNGTSTDYGLGLILGGYRGLKTIHHGGGWIGGNAQLLKIPEVGLDIVIIANRADAFAPVLANRILDRCVAGLEPLEEGFKGPTHTEAFALLRIRGDDSSSSERPGKATLASTFVTGAFRSRTTGRVVQLFGKEGRQIVSIDGHDLPYARCADDVFRPIPIWSFIKRFVSLKGSPSSPTAIELSDFGTVDELAPLERVEEPDVGKVIGYYRSETTATDISIYLAETGPRMCTRGPYGSMDYALECLTDGVWRANSLLSIFLDCIVSFDEVHEQFRLSSYNTRMLPFRRVR